MHNFSTYILEHVGPFCLFAQLFSFICHAGHSCVSAHFLGNIFCPFPPLFFLSSPGCLCFVTAHKMWATRIKSVCPSVWRGCSKDLTLRNGLWGLQLLLLLLVQVLGCHCWPGQYYDEPAKSNMKMRKSSAHWRRGPRAQKRSWSWRKICPNNQKAWGQRLMPPVKANWAH